MKMDEERKVREQHRRLPNEVSLPEKLHVMDEFLTTTSGSRMTVKENLPGRTVHLCHE